MTSKSNQITLAFRTISKIWTMLTIFALAPAAAHSAVDLSAEYFSFDQIKLLINQKQISSVKDLLPILPESYLRNFTLMKQSRSSQGATPQAPRVIMFGKTAQSVIAFNGSPELQGFETIETEEFNPKTQAFEFHKIKFENGQVRFSQKNPSACIACHSGSRNELRPNWDNYSTWQGAFGESDDRVGQKEQSMLDWDPQKALDQLTNSEETKQLQSFLASKDRSPYYKNLLIESTTPVSPYTYQNKGTLRDRPNERLTLLLSRWNAKKIVRMMKTDARYAILRNLILTPYANAREALNLALNKNIFTADEVSKIQANKSSVGDAIFDIIPFSPRDWNLAFLSSRSGGGLPLDSFTLSNDRRYHDGIEGAMYNHVFAELTRDWFSENSSLMNYYQSNITPAGDATLASGYADNGVFDQVGVDVSFQIFSSPVVKQRLLDSTSSLLERVGSKPGLKAPLCRNVVK